VFGVEGLITQGFIGCSLHASCYQRRRNREPRRGAAKQNDQTRRYSAIVKQRAIDFGD
jgi:hypothetical protein